MHVTSADHWSPVPGTVMTWRASPVAGSASVPVPLSLNQHNHLEAAAAGEPSVWLAAAFDVPGAIDVVALEGALSDLVARHGTLQCEAIIDQHGSIGGRRREPSALRWEPRVRATTTDHLETRALVRRCFDRGCEPFGHPAFVPAAISRPGGSTILLALDHLHADAHSLTVVVDDLHALYDARRTGAPAELPEAGCFVDWAREGAPPRVAADDPRLRDWHDFLAARSHTLPVFPLPLGVPAGARVPQETVLRRLADAEELEALTRIGRAQGASTFAVLLVALGGALGRMGCTRPLQMLVPVGLRRREAERRAVGWFTTSVPLEVPTQGGAAALTKTGERLRRARLLAGVPLDQVLATLPRPLVRTRGDVFMVSWMDYRHTPGQERALARGAQHISAPTRADDLQMWLSRTQEGLALRVRLPGTPQARRVVTALHDGWRAELRSLIGAPQPPAAR